MMRIERMQEQLQLLRQRQLQSILGVRRIGSLVAQPHQRLPFSAPLSSLRVLAAAVRGRPVLAVALAVAYA